MYGSPALLMHFRMRIGGKLERLQSWSQQHAALVVSGVVLLGYLIYLPLTDYTKLYFDAGGYWQGAKSYYGTGRFAFFSFFQQRGYLFSLLLAPFTKLEQTYGWVPLRITRLLGASVAAAVFGWAGPALWQAVRGGAPIPLGRRLLFAVLGFLLWRDYFNFSLTDFPALLALSIALVSLLRGRGLASALLAGAAVAAAANMRPVYQAALPAVGLLTLLPPLGRAWWWGGARTATLLLGAALVLWPQLKSNDDHLGIRSPWVITSLPSQPNLYLKQLEWGLQMQKYETSVASDYPMAQMRFEDKRGQALFQATGLAEFTEPHQYLELCLGRPWRAGGVWLRHLFNGLDVQYASPYIQEVFTPTWALAWLNYSLIWGGLFVLLVRRWQRPTSGWVRPVLVLMALLVPCAATLPTAIECRFLLPLHLLLMAAVAFGAAPLRWWQQATRRGRTALVVSYVAVVVAGFSASASSQSHLAIIPRDLLNDLPLRSIAPAPAAQPW